jgi:hypothetical protein
MILQQSTSAVDHEPINRARGPIGAGTNRGLGMSCQPNREPASCPENYKFGWLQGLRK